MSQEYRYVSYLYYLLCHDVVCFSFFPSLRVINYLVAVYSNKLGRSMNWIRRRNWAYTVILRDKINIKNAYPNKKTVMDDGMEVLIY